MNYDVILLSDAQDYTTRVKPLGVQIVASVLRNNVYSVLVLDHTVTIRTEHLLELLKLSISQSTKLVGYSSSLWNYQEHANTEKYQLRSNRFL